MADILQLPTAASEPVINHRQRGSYGRKLTSLRAHKFRLARRERGAEPVDLEAIAEDLRQLAVDGGLHGIAFVIDIGNGLCKAGVAGTLEEDFQPAKEAWLKLDYAMFMARNKDD